ncbi:MAG: LptF/LptG family permease [Planctomycetes bacterium]|nr:LptF/LptG family permease [Planctomycetota bacterium]
MRLERHILKELLVNLVFATAVLYFVFTIGVVIKLFSTLEVPFNVSIKLAPIGLLMQSELLIPLCFLVAVLFTYGRLSAENEYIATQACGVHPARTLAPMLLIGIAICVLQGWLLAFVVPELWLKHNKILADRAIEALMSLEPSRNEFEAKQYGFFMTWKRRDGNYFEDVFLDIKDRQDGDAAAKAPAPVANAAADPEAEAQVLKGIAKSVEIQIDHDAIRLEIRGFRTALKSAISEAGAFEFILNTKERSNLRPRPELLTSDVLIEQTLRAENRVRAAGTPAGGIEKRLVEFDKTNIRRFWYEANRRVAWSFAALLFGALGAPIAIWLRRGTRLAAIVVALGILFTLYFPFSKAGDALAAYPGIPVVVCAWMATAVAGVVSILFFVRLVRR